MQIISTESHNMSINPFDLTLYLRNTRPDIGVMLKTRAQLLVECDRALMRLILSCGGIYRTYI